MLILILLQSDNRNMKLGHRFAGFIDKDTMTVSLDPFTTTRAKI